MWGLLSEVALAAPPCPAPSTAPIAPSLSRLKPTPGSRLAFLGTPNNAENQGPCTKKHVAKTVPNSIDCVPRFIPRFRSQLAEVAIKRDLFGAILKRIGRLRLLPRVT
jgi:hypothetical protein